MSQFVSETPYAERLLEQIQTQGEAGEGWPISSYSTALENFRPVKAGQGRLLGFAGLNTKVAAQFIQVFDANALPADGAVPVFVITVAASSNFGVFWGDAGRWFTRGIVICNSSTAATKTIGSADCWFDAQYI